VLRRIAHRPPGRAHHREQEVGREDPGRKARPEDQRGKIGEDGGRRFGAGPFGGMEQRRIPRLTPPSRSDRAAVESPRDRQEPHPQAQPSPEQDGHCQRQEDPARRRTWIPRWWHCPICRQRLLGFRARTEEEQLAHPSIMAEKRRECSPIRASAADFRGTHESVPCAILTPQARRKPAGQQR
jgi:hypothetical protein